METKRSESQEVNRVSYQFSCRPKYGVDERQNGDIEYDDQIVQLSVHVGGKDLTIFSTYTGVNLYKSRQSLAAFRVG